MEIKMIVRWGKFIATAFSAESEAAALRKYSWKPTSI